MNDLEVKKTAADYAENYRLFSQKLLQAYNILEEAFTIYRNNFAETGYDSMPLPYSHHTDMDNAREDVIKKMRANAWLTILKAMGVQKIVTRDKWDDIYQALHKDKRMPDGTKIPDITTEEIMKIYLAFTQNANDLILESLKSVFDYLTPGTWRKDYVSDKASIGEKVILERVWTLSGDYSLLSYHDKNKLMDVDRIFHFLDGNMAAFYDKSYNSELVDSLQYNSHGETKYFQWRSYRNGNLHLSFKRKDLVSELNRACSTNRLEKP